MDVAAVLKEISSWPVESQIELVEGAWNQLANQGWEPGFPIEHADELNRRLDELEANPNDYLTWDELLQKVRPSR